MSKETCIELKCEGWMSPPAAICVNKENPSRCHLYCKSFVIRDRAWHRDFCSLYRKFVNEGFERLEGCIKDFGFPGKGEDLISEKTYSIDNFEPKGEKA